MSREKLKRLPWGEAEREGGREGEGKRGRVGGRVRERERQRRRWSGIK